MLLLKGSTKWNKIIFLQNKKDLDIILFKSFHAPALNASCFLLEHQWMFEPFLIVVFESINCPRCEKMDQNHTVTAGKGSNMQKMLENWRICRTWRISLKNRTNKGLMNNHHKTLVDHQVTTHCINNQGFTNFWMGIFYICITFTFNHLADAFIQSDVQMRRTIEAIRPSREQQYTSAMTSLS